MTLQDNDGLEPCCLLVVVVVMGNTWKGLPASVVLPAKCLPRASLALQSTKGNGKGAKACFRLLHPHGKSSVIVLLFPVCYRKLGMVTFLAACQPNIMVANTAVVPYTTNMYLEIILIHIYVYIYVYVFTYMPAHIHTYVHIYIHTQICILSFAKL